MSATLRQLEASVFQTRIGFFGAVTQDRTIFRIVIGQPSASSARKILLQSVEDTPEFSNPSETVSETLAQVRDALTEYTHGRRVDFSNFQLDLNHLTPYQKKVAAVVRSIPYGETLSYSQVAKLSGSPKSARAVGTVMAKNRFPILIPCHRVLAAGGKLGGFSAPGGISFKQTLLDLESSGK